MAQFGASQGRPWSDNFFLERSRDRYNELKSLKFMPEKGFANGLPDVSEIFSLLRDRRWLKFNELLEKSKLSGNDRLVREFYANAWQPTIEQRNYKVYVRGVMVDYSPDALNIFLEARIPRDGCALMAPRPIDDMTKEERTVIRDFVGRHGIECHKYRGGPAPKNMKLVDFKPAARAWGHWLSESICRIARHPGTCSLGHCNLITALCRHLKVPETFDDPSFHPIKAMTFLAYSEFEEDPIGGPEEVEEEDAELQEIDMCEACVHPDQHQPEMLGHTHSDDEIAALMTQLAIAERPSFQPPPMYPTYPSLEQLRAQHDIENAQSADRHVSEEQRWGDEYAAYQQTHLYEANLGLGRRQDGSGPSHRQ
ncbi:hypothetical protein P8452_21857 [Trifolium repens]|nr:hypothetical protein P8452_21857 [Trifolium repens]